MFRHLKAEEFINLIEGEPVSADCAGHVATCQRCQEMRQSIESAYSKVMALDEDVLEPEWSEFRSSVRDEMLSRSVQRQTVVRRWTGWSLRPAAAWSFSVLLAIGITAGAFMWTGRPAIAPPAETTSAASIFPAIDDPAPPFIESTELIETQGIETEMTAWSNRTLFQELGALESDEAESLLQLLQTEDIKTVFPGPLQGQ